MRICITKTNNANNNQKYIGIINAMPIANFFDKITASKSAIDPMVRMPKKLHKT
jgi:hypothetical protein